ncbi:MAG: ABC transporter ATP-binding protein [Acidobacteriia bacterium]|nr:ABC transporter ATP-binding protein [Terriglobia bacterium]
MIEVCHLCKSFGELRAVEDVSFRAGAGESFALLGPNGSGKSTTLKCLVGLMRPTSGQLLINLPEGRKEIGEARELLSYLPQRVVFQENLTVQEILEFYRRLRKLPAGRIEQVLERFSLNFNGLADRPIRELSGGMTQRLGIAVALLPGAPVLILDEPTTSLDPEGTIQFRQFINSLKKEGKTIIFSTHVLSDVEAMADQVAVLVGGRLVAAESVATLREEFMNSSRICLVLLNPEERFIRVALDAGARDARLADRRLIVLAAPQERLPILRALEATGAMIERFSTEEPSLEEIYLRYINEKNPPTSVGGNGGMRRPSGTS